MARKENIIPVPIKLAHDGCVSYIEQIKYAIRIAGIETFEILPSISENNESLWEFFHRHQFFNTDNCRVQLLVVFDQFEEIFTLQNSEVKRKDFFVELADLVNNVMPQYIVDNRMSDSFEVINKQANVNSFIVEQDEENQLNLNIDFDIQNTDAVHIRDYSTELSVHFVFTIREDFLSYLERYTAHIPTMRENRFALLPLNQKQAEEIIMQPIQGLVSSDVARLIIRKITGISDLEFEDVSDFEVDAAVLSLYLSRLFDEMQSIGEHKISSQLVEQAGTNIIQHFYEDCVAPLTIEKQEKLESLLLTGDGRRDNVSFTDFKAAGFSNDDIHYLVDDVKLLRQFSMRGDLRIEYIHDILCPIIIEVQTGRLVRKKAQQEKIRKKIYKYIIFILLFFIFIFFRIYPYFSFTDINIQLVEANTINNEEYWKSSIALIDGNDTIALDTIDKGKPYTTISVFNNRTNHLLKCCITPLIGNTKNIQVPINLKDSLNYRIQIDKNQQKPFINGNVRVSSGSIQPVIGAIVIWGNQVTITDRKGCFSFNKPNDYGITSSKDSTIKIIKHGYEVLEENIHSPKELYKLKLKNPKEFYDKCTIFENEFKLSNNTITSSGKYVFNGNVITDQIEIKAYRVNDYETDKNLIRGFYYYKDRIQNTPNRHSLYILFEGYYKRNGELVITSTDDAWNARTITGNIKDNRQIIGLLYANNNCYKIEYKAEQPMLFTK